MPAFDLVIESDVPKTMRVRQLAALFDVPASEKMRLQWKGTLPLDVRPWSVGLIVGPSGCGKSSIVRHVFGDPVVLKWSGGAVVDDFAKSLSMEDIASACSAVGFNTIPAWMRSFGVLSNGERFRADLARRLLETEGMIVVDEFSSVVDRQVAKIGAHAVQKYVRKHGRQFIAATCHYDVLDWLQPDWVFEPATMAFQWRELQRHPSIDIEIGRLPYAAWKLFAPYHYMSADLNRAARCFGLWAEGTLAAFAGMLHRPHALVRDISGCSRLVTLPDWQGLGLAMILIETVAAAYRAVGRRVHTYPAHPSLIRSFDHSPTWRLVKKPGVCNTKTSGTLTGPGFGTRPCAVFCYSGSAGDARLVA